MKILFRLCVFGLLLAALVVGGGWLWLQNYATAKSNLSDETSVVIASGSGGQKIASQLADAGVISHPDAFRALAVMQKKHAKFQAGEYLFAPFITPQAVIDQLAKGDVVRHKVTIPEGKTTAEILEILAKVPLLSGDVPNVPEEGSLLPETYLFDRGQSRISILEQMAAAQQKVIKKLWPGRQKGLPFDTIEEALTLASIVEKETGVEHERRRVAAVYINRLHKGMKLQADPTVSYGLHGGQSGVRPLTYADLRKDTPYNTYTRTGLPPAPICNPGAKSIAAVLDPISSKEIYFVATGDGGHFFAENHDGHLKNVAKYRKWQKAQKRK